MVRCITFSGLPANQDLNEMVPQYEQMSLFGQDKAVQQKAEKPFDELEQAVDGEVLRFGILTYRLDLAQLIRSCTLEILNANGCIVDEMNLDSAIPMNWKEAVRKMKLLSLRKKLVMSMAFKSTVFGIQTAEKICTERWVKNGCHCYIRV